MTRPHLVNRSTRREPKSEEVGREPRPQRRTQSTAQQGHTTPISQRTPAQQRVEPEGTGRAGQGFFRHSLSSRERVTGAYPGTVRKLATALGVAPEALLYGRSTEK